MDFEYGLGYVKTNDDREFVFIAKGLEGKVDIAMPIRFEIKQTRVGLIAVNINSAS